jgi:hypothetical protein
MEFLSRTAVMLLFMAFLSVRASAESQQLAIVTLASAADLSKVRSLHILVPWDEATRRAVITIDRAEIPTLKSTTGVMDVSPARKATLELSQETFDLRATQRLGGVVLQRYENAPLLSVVVPTERFNELRSLPGVIRVRKPKTVTPSGTR